MSTETIDTSTFGAYLRSLRLYGRGIAGARTQRQVADEMGVSVVDYSKWEAHRLPPPDEATVERLMAVLGGRPVTAMELMHEWQPAPPDPPGMAIACGPSGCRVQRVGEP